jgi:hypothetical protein
MNCRLLDFVWYLNSLEAMEAGPLILTFHRTKESAPHMEAELLFVTENQLVFVQLYTSVHYRQENVLQDKSDTIGVELRLVFSFPTALPCFWIFSHYARPQYLTLLFLFIED